jgi:hypothetical protein
MQSYYHPDRIGASARPTARRRRAAAATASGVRDSDRGPTCLVATTALLRGVHRDDGVREPTTIWTPKLASMV